MVFEQAGDFGLFFIGVFLGYFLMYWIRRDKVEGKGLAAVLAVVVGITTWSGSFASSSLDEYGLGLFLGLMMNLVLKLVGERIGVPDIAYRFPLPPAP